MCRHLDNFHNMLPGGSEVGELLGTARGIQIKVGRNLTAEAIVQQVRVLWRQQPPQLAPTHIHRPAAKDFAQIVYFSNCQCKAVSACNRALHAQWT